MPNWIQLNQINLLDQHKHTRPTGIEEVGCEESLADSPCGSLRCTAAKPACNVNNRSLLQAPADFGGGNSNLSPKTDFHFEKKHKTFHRCGSISGSANLPTSDNSFRPRARRLCRCRVRLSCASAASAGLSLSLRQHRPFRCEIRAFENSRFH